MKQLAGLLLMLCAASAQTTARSPINLPDSISNLPQQKIGIDDLVGISVYDAPELTRTLRVAGDGTLRLPMVKRRIPVAGLLPAGVEEAIAGALREEEILVDPVVTVSVIEYRSRPISVVGAVKRPTSFQASSAVNLLEAIARAEGLSSEAGPEILVSRMENGADGRPATLVRRIDAKALIDGADPELNLALQGGEEIRVPEAGKIYVVGNVKKPGAFPVRDSSDATLLKALALSEGLLPYAGTIAYIYRREGAGGSKSEIPVELGKIMSRKSPDVPLMANDVLYIPDRSGRRAAMTSLERMIGVGAGLGAAAIYITR